MRNLLNLLSGIVLVVVLSAVASADPIFSDDFETGNLNNWTVTVTNGTMDISTAQNKVPVGGTYSALVNNSLDRVHRNIIADNGGTELSGRVRLSTWIFDSTQTRAWTEIRAYTGTGLPNGGTTQNGTLQQLLAIGKYNNATMPGETYDATKYQARVANGTGMGWFNLNASGVPSRSGGWHEFALEFAANSRDVSFYVDGILGRTITVPSGSMPTSWDTIIIGSVAGGTTAGNAWFDGVTLVPEPGTWVMLVSGALAAVAVFWRKRRLLRL